MTTKAESAAALHARHFAYISISPVLGEDGKTVVSFYVHTSIPSGKLPSLIPGMLLEPYEKVSPCHPDAVAPILALLAAYVIPAVAEEMGVTVEPAP